MEHVFRDCPKALEAWSKLQIEWPQEQKYTQYKEWMQFIFNSYPNQKCKTIACTIWTLWTTRNKLFHKRIQQIEEEIKCFIENYLLELEVIKNKLPVRRIGIERCRPPEPIKIKINFDVDINNKTRNCAQE
ncbi:hypothetical protein PVK06_005641 [Gossypium arboreum]|uniref:Uncharacterized protein n=1 Tax=Gossypium arboreum TaxID=29729 RepID=A0ABR0QV31_GOSAR|nr:hypothetical protein PVK06_005641 [Gossypium arboreum]